MSAGKTVYAKLCKAKANNEPERVDRYHATVRIRTKKSKETK